MGDTDLISACLRALRAALPEGTEVRAHRAEGHAGTAEGDGRVHLEGRWGKLELPFEERAQATSATIALIDRRFGAEAQDRPQKGPSWILFTDYVNVRLASNLREEGIAFVDAQGNAHLWGPKLYVWVSGNRRQTPSVRNSRLLRPAAARVLFVLLQDPRRVGLPYRDLAELADVAPDTVRLVYDDLQAKGHLKVWGKRHRALTRTSETVELWTMAYEDALRPKLQAMRFRRATGQPLGDLADEAALDRAAHHVLLGGEIGASLLTDAVRPATATLHVRPEDRRSVMKELRLIPHPEGEITLLDTFGTTNRWIQEEAKSHLADPLLLHAELMREDDDRLRSTAAQIYDKYIAGRFTSDR